MNNSIIQKIFFSYLNGHILLIMMRVFTFFSFSSIFNNKNITAPIKILIIYCVSLFLFLFIPYENSITSNLDLLLLLIYQILIGMIVGLSLQCIFACVNLTGELISSQMGLSFSVFFDSNNHNQSLVISRFLNIFLFLFFYVWNGHIWIIKILIKSFEFFPLMHPYINRKIFFSLLCFSNIVFFNGLLLSLPVLFFLLTIQTILAIFNRMIPQISLFSIFFPAILIAGLLILKPFILFFSPMLSSFFYYFLKHLFSLLTV